MKKCLIFSHESDIDGLGSVVLAKLAFKEVDYVLEHNPQALEPVVREYFESNKLDEYEKIFITDLALEDPALTMIAESNISKKIQIIDHHERAIKLNLNRYSFTTIIEEDIKRRCATELFYEYLVKNNYLTPTKALDDFVEYTRLEDTWTWKNYNEYGIKAHDLAILHTIIGKDKYIEEMYKKLSSCTEFTYTEEETQLINEKKEKIKKYIEDTLPKLEYLVDEENNKYAAGFIDYEYRNEITEYIIENNNPNDIKYIIIVALEKGKYGQKSYRSVYDDFNVNNIAMKHGGGGHPKAAAVNITKEQKEKIKDMSKQEALIYLVNANSK